MLQLAPATWTMRCGDAGAEVWQRWKADRHISIWVKPAGPPAGRAGGVGTAAYLI
ncbi:hypothetical protein [Acrocarpospora sp. B8E8]|uniref:hypothetical protein n=1 Tax=Acrocarpospora sp. B8E8 TaxID=3153572 RepID=UPI00325E412F